MNGSVRAWIKKNGSTALLIWTVSPVPVGITLGVIRGFMGMPDWLFFGLVTLSLAPVAVALLAFALTIVFCGFFIRPAAGRLAYLAAVTFCVLVQEDTLAARLWFLGAFCGFWMTYWLIFDAWWPVIERTEWWQRRGPKQAEEPKRTTPTP
jgi:hypothetical protein